MKTKVDSYVVQGLPTINKSHNVGKINIAGNAANDQKHMAFGMDT